VVSKKYIAQVYVLIKNLLILKNRSGTTKLSRAVLHISGAFPSVKYLSAY